MISVMVGEYCDGGEGEREEHDAVMLLMLTVLMMTMLMS